MKDCRLVRQIDNHLGAVNVIRFTSDGQYCMSGSDDRTIKLWNPFKINILEESVKNDTSIENALLIKSYEGVHGYSILDLVISQDKSKFASCGMDKSCYLWDVMTGRVIKRIQAHNHTINSITMNNDNTILITASYDKTVKFWDLRSNSYEPIQVLDHDFKDSISCVNIEKSTELTNIITGCIDGKVRIYDIRSGKLHTDDLKSPITSISVNDDYKTYIANCLNNTIYLIDYQHGKVLNHYQDNIHYQHCTYKSEAIYTSDHKYIVSGSENGMIVHWDLVTANVTQVTSKDTHFKAISSIAYHPNKPFFITASYDGTAKIWETIV